MYSTTYLKYFKPFLIKRIFSFPFLRKIDYTQKKTLSYNFLMNPVLGEKEIVVLISCKKIRLIFV
jgi:hypothetical protein